MSDHVYKAYFYSRYEAERAKDVIGTMFKVVGPEPAETPVLNRPWLLTITMPQAAGLSTLVVNPPLLSKIVEIVTKYNGWISDPPS